MKKFKIEDYQLRELKENKLLINIYDLSLKYNYELLPQWKELFFDILCELTKKGFEFHLDFLIDNQEDLLEYMQKHYQDIIKLYQLDIDVRDYIDIADYIFYKDWEKDLDHGIGYFGKDIYLLSIK